MTETKVTNGKTPKMYIEYAELEAEKKVIEAKQTAIKAKLLSDFRENHKESVAFDLGTFSLVTRTSWEYSKATSDMERKLKAKKKAEEIDGTAKAKKGAEFIQFKGSK